MKKKKSFLRIIVIGAILGLLMSILIHNGHWSKFILGLKSINFFIGLLLFLVFIIVNILVHELGHLLSFVFSGIKIRALFVIIFGLFKNENKKWKFRVYFENIKMFGGFVVPNLPEITNDTEYQTVKNKFKKALIDGPIASIVFFSLTFILFMLSWFLFDSNILLGISTNLFIVTFLMTIIIILSSKLHTDEIYGDFVAHKKFEEDNFALAQIIQYSGFSFNDDKDTNKYLYSKIELHYKDNRPSYKIFDLLIVSNYINVYLHTDNLTFNEDIINYYNITSLSTSKNGRELAYLIAAYYYKKNDLIKSFEIFFNIKLRKNNHLSSEQIEILEKQYEHLLNVSDNSEYFKEKIDSIMNNYSILKPIINKVDVLNDLIATLEFKEYYCNVNFKEEEEKIPE